MTERVTNNNSQVQQVYLFHLCILITYVVDYVEINLQCWWYKKQVEIYRLHIFDSVVWSEKKSLDYVCPIHVLLIVYNFVIYMQQNMFLKIYTYEEYIFSYPKKLEDYYAITKHLLNSDETKQDLGKDDDSFLMTFSVFLYT